MHLRKFPWFVLATSILAWAASANLNVQIKEYDVPTPKSRPHDPALAPDGSLWYTGQGANKLGRLDPQTGAFKEYPLKTAGSGPHGLVADKDGNIWFTAISGGYVGKLDPKSGEITEYRPSDGAEIDPHTPVFDHDGILWFTNEETNYIGRLDPKTGKMTLVKAPTAHAVPYGIVILKNNTPFFCEFGTNKLGVARSKTDDDPRVHTAQRRARVHGVSRSPPMDRSSTRTYARGYLGHFDPASGKLLKEWPSPGGSGSEPYGIAVTSDGEVWYSESGVTPNTLVRFDPKSETFGARPDSFRRRHGSQHGSYAGPAALSRLQRSEQGSGGRDGTVALLKERLEISDSAEIVRASTIHTAAPSSDRRALHTAPAAHTRPPTPPAARLSPPAGSTDHAHSPAPTSAPRCLAQSPARARPQSRSPRSPPSMRTRSAAHVPVSRPAPCECQTHSSAAPRCTTPRCISPTAAKASASPANTAKIHATKCSCCQA